MQSEIADSRLADCCCVDFGYTQYTAVVIMYFFKGQPYYIISYKIMAYINIKRVLTNIFIQFVYLTKCL